MPIEHSWSVPKRVVRIHIDGETGLELFRQLIDGVKPFLEEGVEPVHVILDDATAGPPPVSIKQLKAVMDIGKETMNKLGWVVGVGDVNPIAKVVIPLLTRIVKIKYVRVDTMEDALAILKRQDLSLTGELENL